MEIEKKIASTKESSLVLKSLSADQRIELLYAIQDALKREAKSIFEANAQDLLRAERNALSPALHARLEFNEHTLQAVCVMLSAVATQPDMVYKTILRRELAHGLLLRKRLVPFGTICMIFESRPDALVQMASLCLKTANGLILKGGSEAEHTNKRLYEVIVEATHHIATDWIQRMESRSDVDNIIQYRGKNNVDLIIPRGGNEFVNYIMQHATVPVLGHADGICHIYLHPKAHLARAREIVFDAKMQYAAVCNSMECLLVDDKALIFLPPILRPLSDKGARFYVDSSVASILESAQIPYTLATEDAWGKEFQDITLAIKTVCGVDEAVAHINTYGSKHTDAILTEEEEVARHFQNAVDSSSVLWNCSTRFSDGYRYGLGAEVGVSTSKVHARGPVGAEGLFTTQWVLDGDGNTVSSFIHGDAQFTHRDLPHDNM